MIAEDHANSKEASKKIYECIRTKLLFANGDHKLPIIYVIDSILKNARGCYIGLFEDDAKSWMKSVYRALPDETRRTKLKKVWNTWKDFSLFSIEKWRAMGECFDGSASSGEKSPRSSSPLGGTLAAGIPRSVRQHHSLHCNQLVGRQRNSQNMFCFIFLGAASKRVLLYWQLRFARKCKRS